MAWFGGKVSLGNFPDFSEAVNKLSKSVKNIEKNFDSAFGLEEKSNASGDEGDGSGLWPAGTDRKLLEPSTSSNREKQDDKGTKSTVESSEKPDSSKPRPPIGGKKGEDENIPQGSEKRPREEAANEELKLLETEAGFGEKKKDISEEPKDDASSDQPEVEVTDRGPGEKIKDSPEESKDNVTAEQSEAVVTDAGSGEIRKDGSKELKEEATTDQTEAEMHSPSVPVKVSELKIVEDEQGESTNHLPRERSKESFSTPLASIQSESLQNLQDGERAEEMLLPVAESVQTEQTSPVHTVEDVTSVSTVDDNASHLEGADSKSAGEVNDILPAQALDTSSEEQAQSNEPDIPQSISDAKDNTMDQPPIIQYSDPETSKESLDLVKSLDDTVVKPIELKEQLEKDAFASAMLSSTGGNSFNSVDSLTELENLKKEMKLMEAALHGAARQAQAKADEIARMMNENERLETVINDLRRKTNEAEIESLREENHQRVSVLERKIYALTKERDTLRREQNKRSDAAALLKEKDEIITQVMAEGEELSKKQAVQESQIRKQRAQVRELEEEKKGLLSKIQVEENKVESLKRDKAATENFLQETIEKHQTELTTQKEYYTKALNDAKEAEALAEAHANSEATTELEGRLRDAEERESMLVQTLQELRQTLSRKEQQAVFREDMLRRDIEDLQKRYQASERRSEELVTQVPESTRPLLRQIEAMQETASRRAEAWTAVERTLNARLQEAEAKAAVAEEKERSVSDRLSQTLPRINVLEAQISCLRAEQMQLTRSLEKERQRAAEHRQEYLALKEVADTQESRMKQLEEENRELRKKHKEELYELRTHQELLQQEVERERASHFDQERTTHLHSVPIPDPSPRARQKSTTFENGNLSGRMSRASSLNSMEESYFLQTTLGSPGSLSESKTFGEGTLSPYYLKSVTSSTFEAALRQKEGELASYAARLASMESIRDSLAEELVKMTAECEKLRSEANALPGIRAELDALRRRHSAALELMGERDEELEELRADIVDLKEMYREQVNLLVNKIQRLGASITDA